MSRVHHLFHRSEPERALPESPRMYGISCETPSMAQAAIAVFVNHQSNWNLLLKAGLRALQSL